MDNCIKEFVTPLAACKMDSPDKDTDTADILAGETLRVDDGSRPRKENKVTPVPLKFKEE